MKERTLKTSTALLYSVIFAVIVIAVVGLPFYLINKELIKETDLNFNLVYYLCVLVLLTIAHELIHGFFFAKYAKNGFKSVKFGIILKSLTPYCHCKEALSVDKYRIALLMPTVILGIIPIVVAYFISNTTLVILGGVMLIGGIGDIIIYWKLRDLKDNTVILDHPSKIGFYYEEI